MKKLSCEGVSYYMSAMILFNFFYIIKVFSKIQNFCFIDLQNRIIVLDTLFAYIEILIAIIFIIWGLSYTVILFKNDFTPCKGEDGIKIVFKKKDNITSSEFLGKFSLLILTGLTIGEIALWWNLIIYITFYIVVGLIYIRYDMLYINPLLVLCRYEIYKCICLKDGYNEEESYFFVINSNEFARLNEIKITSTDKKIIRINGKGEKNENKNNNI